MKEYQKQIPGSFVEPIFSSFDVASRRREEFAITGYRVEDIQTRVLFDGTKCFSFKAWVMPGAKK